jgi:hypothetical protein
VQVAHEVGPPDARIADAELRELIRLEDDRLMLMRCEGDRPLDWDICYCGSYFTGNGLVRGVVEFDVDGEIGYLQ